MKIVIVGGGPSGLMCAYFASQKEDNQIILLDKNEKIGKKLYITGKGRCNLTNLCSKEDFLRNVVNNSKFLFSAISNFTPQDTINFFNKRGLKTVVERGNRVFPASQKSSEVIKTFQKLLDKNNVKILYNSKVDNVYRNKDKYIVCLDGGKIDCDAFVLATGGASYPSTGSTGDGYKFAKSFSHTIVPIKPALCPILLKNYDGSLAGLTMKNVTISIKIGKKEYSQFGEMLFTHKGVSGPIVLTLSSLVNSFDIRNLPLVIDLKPALSEEQLNNRLLRDFEENRNKSIKNYLKQLMPMSLIPTFLERAKIPMKTNVLDITKSQRKDIVYNLKHLEFIIDKLDDIDYAIVTSGGVKTQEVDPKTMESKFNKNLFFVGEMLDVDALTGGFNIQIALATGVACGKFLAEAKERKED